MILENSQSGMMTYMIHEMPGRTNSLEMEM